MIPLTAAILCLAVFLGATTPTPEKQLTDGPLQKDLDNNINFSPDGERLVFDCRGVGSINTNTQLGVADVRTGKATVFYEQKPPLLGLGAPSFLDNREIVVIQAIPGHFYDLAVRCGAIIPTDGSGKWRHLDSRDMTPPFTPGALRGGTHKHEPDASGQWIGFTYNDAIMKFQHGSDLRNVGVMKRGVRVPVPPDAEGRNFEGESFSVLLTACADDPKPGTDEYGRAEGDCWVGRDGYPKPDGTHQRARAFRGQVAVMEDGQKRLYGDIFVVDVPDDITIPGPLGPLEGTATDYPKPPKGAVVRRLTRTAENPDPRLRGVTSFTRASGDGRWIAFAAKTEREGRIEEQIFVVSPTTGAVRQISHLPGGIAPTVGNARFSPDSRYLVTASVDGGIVALGAEEKNWGEILLRTAPNAHPPSNLVVSPDSHLIAFNREIAGVQQIFLVKMK